MSERAPATQRRDFVLLMLATVTALCNFAPLMPVVPLWAAGGGASGGGVGATTGVMMAATAATQVGMGPVLRRYTLRQIFVAGALIMAAPTPFYLLSDQLVPVLVVSGLRGVGFGLVVVAASALVAEIVPSHLLARGLGIHGLATGLPMVIALPAGVWVAQQVSFVPVFVVATLLAVVGAGLASMLSAGGQSAEERPGPVAGAELLDPDVEGDHSAARASDWLEAEPADTRSPEGPEGPANAGPSEGPGDARPSEGPEDAEQPETVGDARPSEGPEDAGLSAMPGDARPSKGPEDTDESEAGARSRPRIGQRGFLGALGPLLRPALGFFTLTMALGTVNTFLPLAVPEAGVVSMALVVTPLAMVAGRFGSGVLSGYLGPGRLVLPGTLLGAVGMLVLALGTAAGVSSWLVVVGAGIFGLGLGLTQNDSLVVIMGRAGPGRRGLASTVWNFAYDAGMGTGAVLFGALLAGADYPWAFGLVAVVIAVAVPAGRVRVER